MPVKKKKDGSKYLGSGMAAKAGNAKKSRNSRLKAALSATRKARRGK